MLFDNPVHAGIALSRREFYFKPRWLSCDVRLFLQSANFLATNLKKMMGMTQFIQLFNW